MRIVRGSEPKMQITQIKQPLFGTTILLIRCIGSTKTSGGCEQSTVLASSHSTLSSNLSSGAATGMGHHNANPNSNGLSREVSEIIQGILPGTDVSWEKEGNYVTDLVMCIYPYMYVHV